jgi:acyl-coenzyme A thioesterase PaaI-like protein
MITKELLAPEAVAEPGWTKIAMPVKTTTEGPAFLRGGPGQGRLRVAYFARDRDDVLVGKAWFGPGAEGPPGHAHGGSIAAVLDEAMGAAAWRAGHVVVAANLSVDYRHMLPLGTDALFEAHVTTVEGRKVRTVGRITGPSGELYAEGRGLYVQLSPEQVARYIA